MTCDLTPWPITLKWDDPRYQPSRRKFVSHQEKTSLLVREGGVRKGNKKKFIQGSCSTSMPLLECASGTPSGLLSMTNLTHLVFRWPASAWLTTLHQPTMACAMSKGAWRLKAIKKPTEHVCWRKRAKRVTLVHGTSAEMLWQAARSR